MSEPIVIEPGTPAYNTIAMAVAIGKKISIEARGPGHVAIKVSEYMWSASLSSTRPASFSNSGPGFEPPANT